MNRDQCRQILEQHYKAPFNRSTVNKFSIDFYNKDLMIGLQYNSVHHYKYSPKFHKIYRKFKETQRKDTQRKEMCKEAGITLISIPYNTPCIPGTLRKILKISNDCCCYDCLNIRRLSTPSRADRIKQADENYSK